MAIELVVRLICEKPDSGERKVADLVSVRVYKFRFQRQEYLLAYRVDPVGAVSGELSITFLLVGTHENFYDELKRYLHSDLN